MKHVRKFESFQNNKRKEEIIKESVLMVNDIYKVRTTVDVPQSLLNAYTKRVKEVSGKNLKQYFGDVDLSEEIVKYIVTNYLDADKIPANAILGGQAQAQTAEAQPAPQAEAGDAQVQVEPEAQAAPQVQAEAEAQPQIEAQPEAQAVPEAQPAPQGEFEETKEEEKPEGEEETKEEGEEELPL